MIKLFLSIVIFNIVIHGNSYGQKDSLILMNGNMIVGEFKDMDRGVIEVKTPYSKSDFKVKWEGIKEIYSDTRFLITLTDGNRYTSTISSGGDEKVLIYDEEGGEHKINLQDIVLLKSLKDGFWDRLNASIDFGYSFTKARNFKQVTMRSAIGYLADRWSMTLYYNALHST